MCKLYKNHTHLHYINCFLHNRSLKRKARKETQNIKSLTDAILPDVQQTSKSVGKLKENLAKNNSSSVNTSKNHVAPTNQMVDTNHQWVQEMNKINRQKSKETFKECKAKDTDKKEESIQLTSTSTEFSPILYWREPIPEVDILDLELPPTSSSNPKVINSSKNFLGIKSINLSHLFSHKSSYLVSYSVCFLIFNVFNS